MLRLLTEAHGRTSVLGRRHNKHGTDRGNENDKELAVRAKSRRSQWKRGEMKEQRFEGLNKKLLSFEGSGKLDVAKRRRRKFRRVLIVPIQAIEECPTQWNRLNINGMCTSSGKCKD